jgi:hypothetical protein
MENETYVYRLYQTMSSVGTLAPVGQGENHGRPADSR